VLEAIENSMCMPGNAALHAGDIIVFIMDSLNTLHHDVAPAIQIHKKKYESLNSIKFDIEYYAIEIRKYWNY